MSSWAKVLKTKQVPSSVTSSKKSKRRVAIDAPDVSKIPTPDDTFDHKYNYKLMLIEEKLHEYLDINGYSPYILSDLKPGDFQEFAKYASTEFNELKYKYRRKIRGVYRHSNVKYKYVDTDEDDSS